MGAKRLYCSRCDRQVPVTFTEAPMHRGHANVPGAPELVCMGMSRLCTGADACPLTSLSPAVMRARLRERGIRRQEAPAAEVREVIAALTVSGYASVPGREREIGGGTLR
jgi:hypothetical protein